MTGPGDFVARRARLWEKLDGAGIDVLFLPSSQSDLEYFTGLRRRTPTFGAIGYSNHWVSGAFIAPGREPLFVLPRHYQEFDLPDGVDSGEIVTVNEGDDGRRLFGAALDATVRSPTRIAVAGRTWAQTTLELQRKAPLSEVVTADRLLNTIRRIKDAHEIELMRRAALLVDGVLAELEPRVIPGVSELDLASEIDLLMRRGGALGPSFDSAVWAMGPGTERDATVRLSTATLQAGSGVSFDFGAVVDGYCSDFGRTIHLGQPSTEYVRVHEVVMAAQEAGRTAAVPGATGGEVHRATRAVIEEVGYGEWFRHRTGHCIGLDVHELPYISDEDETPLEPGMVFTIEPSVFWPGRVGVRVEDIFLCTEKGAVRLNRHPTALVANG